MSEPEIDYPRPFSILIVGIGGQGIVTLSDILRKAAISDGHHVRGTVRRGGAQTLGSVSATLRLLMDGDPDMVAPVPAPGELDLVIGLEAWETARRIGEFGSTTRIIVSIFSSMLPVERQGNPPDVDPLEALRATGLDPLFRDWASGARQDPFPAGSANLLAGLDAVGAGMLPVSMEAYLDAACERLGLNESRRSALLQHAAS